MYVDYNEVGKRLSARRKELGMKQFQVSEAAGLSDKYLSNLERATSVMSIDVLMKLCNVLKVSPDYLLLGTTERLNSEDIEQRFLQMLSSMNEKQIKMVFSFMEWLSLQEL